MVGVRGKYKGCETCRARRVKCDNTRPYCKKCLDNGRLCAGYERETVFIIGTIQDEGRCSSHPPRVVKSTTKRGGTPGGTAKKEEKLELIPVEPFQPAWDDLITLSNPKKQKHYRVQIAALQTNLQALVRNNDEGESSKFTLLSLPPYEPSNPHPQPSLRDDDFDLRSQCLVYLDDNVDGDAMKTEDTDMNNTDSICLFLYEHNNSLMFNNQPLYNDASIQGNMVRRLGPVNFQNFPNHHFFVRVYRHSAICTALLNRKPSFLASAEWLSTPWEVHPKSFFDRLFDIVAFLPTVLARADRIFPRDPTLQRRLMAQELLGHCLNLEGQLGQWYASIDPGAAASQSAINSTIFWIEDPEHSGAQIPFADTFAFHDAVTATTMLYYWSSLVLFYPCIERLYETIFHHVMDTFPQTEPALPRHLQISPHRYGPKEVRELAANICRSLDFALNATVQPDMLVVPLFVVQEFYRSINESAGDGQLELMWCEGFRLRLAMKGQDITEVIQDKKWRDLATY